MTTSISSALTLMVIGMITVFLVLFLVHQTGSLLIKAINRWFPETQTSTVLATAVSNASGEITPQQIAAITTAVEVFSEGKAHIVNIEKQ